MNMNIAFWVVISAAVMATITDLKERIIYRRLTVPLFTGGLFYSLIQYQPYLTYITFSKKGAYLAWYILQSWLGPVLIIAAFMVFLFWLGILGGGDGHFMIAITPWLGPLKMAQFFIYLFPVLLIYLSLYLLFRYKFNIKQLLLDQLANIVILFKHLPTVSNNITSGTSNVLETRIPFAPNTKRLKPPAMVAIILAIVLTYV